MRRLQSSVAVSIVVLGSVGASYAADVPIAGLKLIVVDKGASQAKAVFVSKDSAVTKGSGTDASDISAILDISYDAASGSFDMQQGAGWLVNSASVAKYVNKTTPTNGATKVSAIKPGLLVKVVGKSTGDVPLDISTAPTGAVYVADTIVNGADTTRLCTQFNVCVHKVIAGGTGYKLVCKGNSEGDASCAAAPPTSTTSTTIFDPCTNGNGGCDPLTSCTNDGGSPLCGPCPGGYTGTGDTTCNDINECTVNGGGCSLGFFCANAPGSFACNDINECATTNGGCNPVAACANTPGSHTCTCNSGFTGNGITCTDINECATVNGGCSTFPPVSCTNTAPGWTCGPCPGGYTGDGVSCTDINECANNNGGCSVLATCANTVGSRTCTCNGTCTGNGITCIDVNECATTNGGCGIGVTCTNTPSCSAGVTCTP